MHLRILSSVLLIEIFNLQDKGLSYRKKTCSLIIAENTYKILRDYRTCQVKSCLRFKYTATEHISIVKA